MMECEKNNSLVEQKRKNGIYKNLDKEMHSSKVPSCPSQSSLIGIIQIQSLHLSIPLPSGSPGPHALSRNLRLRLLSFREGSGANKTIRILTNHTQIYHYQETMVA